MQSLSPAVRLSVLFLPVISLSVPRRSVPFRFLCRTTLRSRHPLLINCWRETRDMLHPRENSVNAHVKPVKWSQRNGFYSFKLLFCQLVRSPEGREKSNRIRGDQCENLPLPSQREGSPAEKCEKWQWSENFSESSGMKTSSKGSKQRGKSPKEGNSPLFSGVYLCQHQKKPYQCWFWAPGTISVIFLPVWQYKWNVKYDFGMKSTHYSGKPRGKKSFEEEPWVRVNHRAVGAVAPLVSPPPPPPRR
jgi:hypothetical protein